MTGPFRFPPDYEPPLPADVATNRTTLAVVLLIFAFGIAACGIAFALLR